MRYERLEAEDIVPVNPVGHKPAIGGAYSGCPIRVDLRVLV